MDPICLTRLEKQHGNLAEVEIDEMFGLVGHVRTKVASNNAMPRGVMLLVELLLDVGGNVLLNVELLQRLGGAINRVLLHLFGHVSILHNSLSVRHLLWLGTGSERKERGAKEGRENKTQQPNVPNK